jgi:hypothetical protein
MVPRISWDLIVGSSEESSTLTHRLLRLYAIICLFALLLPAPQPGVTPPVDAPQVMPPHLSLRKRIARGEVRLPPHMADPGIARAPGLDAAQPDLAPLAGSIRARTVLVSFSDNVSSTVAIYFDTLVFGASKPGRDSVRGYFNEVSYGQVDITSATLPSDLGWQRAPETYATVSLAATASTRLYPNERGQAA